MGTTGFAAVAAGSRRPRTDKLRRVQFHHVVSTGCSTVKPCASVSEMRGVQLDANGEPKKNYLPSKVFLALSKVFLVLFKAFHPLSAVNQNDRAISAFGISLTLLDQTSSRPSGSLRISRRGSALPLAVRCSPLPSRRRCGCGSLATPCEPMAWTTRRQYFWEPNNNCMRSMHHHVPALGRLSTTPVLASSPSSYSGPLRRP